MIVLGRVTAPFGVRGWVRIHAFADDPLAWCDMPRWWLAAEAGAQDWIPYGLKDCRAHGTGLVVAFDGIADRTAAEALQGKLVAAPRDALPATGADEYYWTDLIGLVVVNDEGATLGKVTDLLSTGAHEVLVVREDPDTEGGRQHLLPFVEAVVREVDRVGGLIRVAWQPDW